MTDAIDDAVTRSANRAVFVGAGVKYLGKARRRDAEFLADLMVAAIDQICTSAIVTFASTDTAVSKEILQNLGDQVHRHAEGIAHVAVRAMSDVYLKTLICAARALDNAPIDN